MSIGVLAAEEKMRCSTSAPDVIRTPGALSSGANFAGDEGVGGALDADGGIVTVAGIQAPCRPDSVSRCAWILRMRVKKSPPGRSVRPIDPLKSTSPAITNPFPTKLTLPGEWPGV